MSKHVCEGCAWKGHGAWDACPIASDYDPPTTSCVYYHTNDAASSGCLVWIVFAVSAVLALTVCGCAKKQVPQTRDYTVWQVVRNYNDMPPTITVYYTVAPSTGLKQTLACYVTVPLVDGWEERAANLISLTIGLQQLDIEKLNKKEK